MSLNKIVLITGSAGFIGLNVVKKFVGSDWTIYALVHNNVPDVLKELDVNLVKADVTDEKSVMSALNGVQPEVVIHVAGLASDIGADELYRKINFEPIKYLSKFAKRKFIYMSSTDVYGIKDFSGEDEESLPFEPKPINPYPKYKIESEKWLRANCNKNKFVIIRPAAVWGEGDKTLENRVVDFLSTSPVIVNFGKWKGENRWPLANVKNVANVIYTVANIDDYDGQAINIIDEERTSIDEYYRNVARKYFPDKKFGSITLPFGLGKILGFISTVLSNAMNLKQPLFDPTYYAVHHVSSNLDFSAKKMLEVLNKDVK